MREPSQPPCAAIRAPPSRPAIEGLFRRRVRDASFAFLHENTTNARRRRQPARPDFASKGFPRNKEKKMDGMTHAMAVKRELATEIERCMRSEGLSKPL